MGLNRQNAKNVASGWLSLMIHVVVGFFLSPFILHKLGDAAFGVWVLIFSLTGYYGLFDFGIRTSIVRYVAKLTAARDEEQLARFLSTALATYGVVALLVLLVTIVGSLYLGNVFRIPPDLLRASQLLFALVGAELAIEFPLSVFAGVIEGLQKFTWLNLTQIVFTLLRAFFIVLLLEGGFGLLGIGVVSVSLNLLNYGLVVGLTFKLLPLRLGARLVDRGAFRQMITYSSVAFLIVIAEKLRFQSDVAVIGMFLSSTAVTYFAVGLKLAEYPATLVQSLAQVFTPMSSHFEATGDSERLRKVFIEGNRACALTIFPLCTILVILGKQIIEVWVGAKYLASYSVLLLLLVPRTLYLAQAASTRVLLGLNRHRPLALILLLEGGLNLVLSIVLLRYFGIVGVALGTAVPLTVTSLLFLPRHVCHLLRVPLRSYLRRAYLLPLGLCGPLAIVLLCTKRLIQVHNYSQLLLQIAPGAVVYGLGLMGFLLTAEPTGIGLRARIGASRKPA